MTRSAIYLDNHATTRCDPRVFEAMLPFFTERYGNAASRTHRFGQEAGDAVQIAREQVAALLSAQPNEIVFTSGATESDNLALKGMAHAARPWGDHLITVATEHRAVLDPCKRLERDGYRVTVLPVDPYGRVTLEQVAAAITEKTVLVSVMAANNEVGTLQPIGAIGKLCKERRVYFHTDAAQAAGKLPLDVEEMGVDLLSLSAHKMFGPKGVGALYVRRRNPRVRPEPLLDGGGHENGLRSGTLPVPLVVGFGKACELCRAELAEEGQRVAALRDRLWQGLNKRLDGVFLNGHPVERLPGNLNVSFAHIHSDALLMAVRDLALSTGSACTSASVEPSYVLRALGVADELAQGSVRFGLGRFTTAEEIETTIEQVAAAVVRLRRISPAAELERQGNALPARAFGTGET